MGYCLAPAKVIDTRVADLRIYYESRVLWFTIVFLTQSAAIMTDHVRPTLGMTVSMASRTTSYGSTMVAGLGLEYVTHVCTKKFST